MAVELKLRALRNEVDVSQAVLAKAVGVRQATINDLENGHSTRIDFELIESLCKYFTKHLKRDVEPGHLLVWKRRK